MGRCLGFRLGGGIWCGLGPGFRRDRGFCLQSRRRGVLFLRQRLGDSQGLGMAAIGLGIGGLVDLGRGNVLGLELGRSHVLVVRGHQFLRRGGVLNAARAAVVGHMIGVGDDPGLHDCRVDVGGVDDGLIHMHDGGVVGERTPAPLAPGKADAAVAEAVVHAPVVANVRAPIAIMEPVMAALPAPIGRGPQRALVGRGNPGAGHPEIAVRSVGPKAGGPHQVGLRALGLHINRQRRRSKTDADDKL